MAKTRKKTSARRSHRHHTTRDLHREIERLHNEIAKLQDSVALSQKVANAFKESETLYRSLVDTSPDAVTVTDLEGRVIYVSMQTLRLHGYDRADEVLGKSALEFIAPHDRDLATANMKRTFEHGCIRDVEYTFLRKDGSEFIGGLNASLVKDADGKPKGFIATTRDITEIKKQTAELQASEEKYRQVVEQSVQGIFIVSGWPPHIVYANEATATILGYTLEKLLRLSDKQILTMMHPDDRTALFDRFKEVIAGSAPRPRQVRLFRKDGSVRWLEVMSQRIMHENHPALQVAAVDITERKQADEALRASEEKYRHVVEQAILGIIIVQGSPVRMVFVNDAAARMFGYSVKQLTSLSGKKTWALIHTHDRAVLMQRFKDILAGKPSVPRQIRIIRKDGAVRWLEIFGRRLEYQGQPAIQVSAIDITERREAEAALRDSEEKFSNLYHHSNDAIFLHDLDGTILDANERVSTLFGYSRQELLALKIAALHPKEELKRSRAAFAAIARDGFVNFEVTFRKKDGTTFPGEVSSRLFEISGERVIQGIVRDVSERKQAEYEINRRLAMEEALAAISENLVKARDIDKAVFDTLHRLADVFCTDRVCLFQRRGEQKIWDKTHEWYVPGLKSLRWKFQGITSQRYSFWLGKLKRDSAIIVSDVKKLPAYARKSLGGLKIASMLMVPLFFEDEFFGALGIFAEKKAQTWQQDDARILRAAGEIITASLVKDHYQKELTRVLNELQSQRKKLFELTQRSIDAQERERLYLASEIHDELLQGLVAVLYFLQMLDTRTFDTRTQEKRAALIKIIKSSIDRARSLISEVEPIRDPDIGLIQAIKKSLKNRLATMPIRVRFNYPKKLPRIAFAQKANLLRIVQEALTNVRKHSQATRLSLKIATCDDKLELSLKDNGIGFDVDRALKKMSGHFGLVSIQERALLVGGQLTITSTPGKGTRVHGLFPLGRDNT